MGHLTQKAPPLTVLLGHPSWEFMTVSLDIVGSPMIIVAVTVCTFCFTVIVVLQVSGMDGEGFGCMYTVDFD